MTAFLLLYFLQRSQYDFFSDATMLLAGLGCGAFALSYFFRALHRHERPLIGLKALRHQQKRTTGCRCLGSPRKR